MPTYKARIVFRKTQVSEHTGKAQCIMRVSIASRQFMVSTGVYIEPHQWDENRQRVNRRKAHSSSEKEMSSSDMNLILDNALARASEIFTEYRLRKNIVLTKEIFLQEYHNPSNRTDFLSFMKTAINSEVNRRQISKSTEEKHRLTLKKLQKFRKEILFSHLNRRLILEFDEWHLEHLRKSQRGRLIADGQNTRINALKIIAKYLKIAKQDKIKFEWPIYDINLTQRFEGRTFLNPVELNQFLDLFYSENPDIPLNWKLVLRYFLFGCYTGLAFSDLRDLKWESNIYWEEKRLQYIRNKNNKYRNTVTVPLCLQAIDLLKDTQLNPPGTGPVFKVISEQKTNQNLRKITKYLGLNKKVTTHTARHSFASCFLMYGGKLVALKKLMGHRKIETTMIYAHLTDKSVEDQIEATFDQHYSKR